jgi:chaperonin cofactor prefoldin
MKACPSRRDFRIALPLLAILSFLMISMPIPVANASTGGPAGYWYVYWLTGYNVDNAYQAYPGGTIFLNYVIVNSQTSGSITITQIQATTPWQTYTDTSLPITINQGQDYYGYFSISIPASETLGNISISYTDSVNGYNVVTGTLRTTIYANPSALQSQINTLNSQITSLQSQASSLQSQLTAAQANATNLQSKVTSLQGQVSSLQSQLTAAQTNATNLQKSVVSLKSQLSASQSQLSMTQSQLSNATSKVSTLTTQLQSAQSDISNKTAQISTLSSQLSTTQASLATANASLAFSQGEVATYSSFYLPVGVAVPSVVAVILLVLYLRKGARPAGAAVGMPPPQAVSAMAPPAEAGSSSRFCQECGTENKPGAKFCAKCGASLS